MGHLTIPKALQLEHFKVIESLMKWWICDFREPQQWRHGINFEPPQQLHDSAEYLLILKFDNKCKSCPHSLSLSINSMLYS